MGMRIRALMLRELFSLDAMRVKAISVSLGHLFQLVGSGFAWGRHP